MIKYLKFAFLSLLVCTAPLHASTAETDVATLGWHEFVRGDFREAIVLGRTAGTANGYALACRSGLTLGGFVVKGTETITLLHDAATDCQKALALNPDHYFARMSLAIALSFEGKRLRRVAYAKRAKVYIQDLIAAEPDNALGYGALAAWHAEVSAAGFWARLLLGAKRKLARENFQKALGMGAIDFPLQFEYVKFLARGNGADRLRAVELADAIKAQPSSLAVDMLIKERCARLRPVLIRGGKKAIRAALKEVSAFRHIEDLAAIEPFPLTEPAIPASQTS